MLGGNPEFAAREQLRGLGLVPEEHDEEFRALVEKYKPEFDAARETVLNAGGLYIIGSERHESRRIDNQLRGRSGRQGDPGESRFFLSLQDDLMKMYGGERVEKLMEFLKIEEDVPIESGMLTRSIENAQKKVEGRNFEARRHVLSYDDVMNKQRTVIYDERRRILDGGDLRDQTLDFLQSAVERVVKNNSVRPRPRHRSRLRLRCSSKRARASRCRMSRRNSWKCMDQDAADRLPVRERAQPLLQRRKRKSGASSCAGCNPEITEEELAAKAAEIGAPNMRELERVITLKSIDENWIDHLNMLDHLRSGVSLRGYGQQDPVVIYAQEAFDAFENMKEQVQLDVIRKLFMVRLETPEQIERKSAYNIRGAGKAEAGLTDEHGKRVAEKRIAAKMGRNTPCYCGSGKKYKQCHLPIDNGNPPEDWVEQYVKHYGEQPSEAAIASAGSRRRQHAAAL